MTTVRFLSVRQGTRKDQNFLGFQLVRIEPSMFWPFDVIVYVCMKNFNGRLILDIIYSKCISVLLWS